MFGPPGIGKGTQCKLLSDKYHLLHISTGDLLRSEVNQNTDIGKTITNSLKNNVLIPDDVVINLLFDFLSKNTDRAGLILDGFPYTLFQAQKLHAFLENQLSKIHLAVQLTSSNDQELFNRISVRAKTSGRLEDQKSETIWERIKSYSTDVYHLSMIDFYSKQGILREIDGLNSQNTVFDRIDTEIKKVML